MELPLFVFLSVVEKISTAWKEDNRRDAMSKLVEENK
jgi:hypothetical protein